MAASTPWDQLFADDFLYRERCWEGCGGGYCCKPTRVQRHFSLLRREGVELPLLPGELRWLQDRGLLQRGFDSALTCHRVSLPSGAVFPIYRTVCHLDGRCSDHTHRPVVCRIYPFAPVPDVEGKVERLEPVAVIDLFWAELAGAQDPCIVGALSAAERARFEAMCGLLFADPINIFYLKAASIFKNAVKRGVVERFPQLLERDEASFFSTWEKLLVFGQLYSSADVLAEIDTFRADLEARWGADFDLRTLQEDPR